MSLEFPASPSVGDTYSVGARTWSWSGTIWEITGTVAAAGSIGTAELATSAVTSAKIAASPSLTGTPLAPTAAGGTNTTQIATTEFVTTALSGAAITALDDVGDVTITSASSGQLLKWNGTAWVNASFPKIYVEKFTTNGSGTWTCPAGVTQIKLTLIGAGGAGGNASAEAILPTATNYQSYASQTDTAGSTTFVVGGTSYTALGGKKGIDHNVSVTGDSHNGGFSNSTSFSSSQTEFRAENRYPGSGGGGFGVVSGLAWTFYVEYGADTWQHIIRARAEARSGRGQDGVTEVFQVTVVPLTVYSFTVGAGAGYAGTTSASMGSNGAATIEYVI
jgi:hypothetical protein